MNNDVFIGDILQTLRKRSRLTLREVYAKTGVHYTEIALWESGRRLPNYLKLRQVLPAYNCSLIFQENDEIGKSEVKLKLLNDL